jgi:hypothetical protein
MLGAEEHVLQRECPALTLDCYVDAAPDGAQNVDLDFESPAVVASPHRSQNRKKIAFDMRM